MIVFMKLNRRMKDLSTENYIQGLFFLSFLCISILLSASALMGDFRTYVFGIKHQFMWDPGGPYLSSGAYFFRSAKIHNFHAHPGLILQLVIGIVSEIYYWCAKLAGCNATYAKFIIKNYYWIIFSIKTIITCAHLCSFYVLNRIATRIVDHRLAVIAMVAYASTYPVFYYINNISPDTITVLFILCTILCVFKFLETNNISTVKSKNIIIFGVAFFSIAACFSKIMIGLPATVAVWIYMVIIIIKQQRKIFSKFKDCFILFSSSIGFALIWTQKLEWSRFFEFWSKYTPGSGTLDVNEGMTDKAFHIAVYFFKGVFKLTNWIPEYSKLGLFITAECVFILISFWGIYLFYKKANPIEKRKLYLILLISIFILPVVIYRSAFHYFFLYMAFASLFFSYAIIDWFKNYLAEHVGWQQKTILAMSIILILHLPGLIISIDGKKHDARVYNKEFKAFYSALGGINYNERIAIEGNPKNILGALGLKLHTDPKILRKTALSYVVKKAKSTGKSNTPLVIKWDKLKKTHSIERF